MRECMCRGKWKGTSQEWECLRVSRGQERCKDVEERIGCFLRREEDRRERGGERKGGREERDEVRAPAYLGRGRGVTLGRKKKKTIF